MVGALVPGAQAYNACSGSGAPSGVQGQSPWSGSQGAKPPKAESFLHWNVQEKHQFYPLLQFCKLRKPPIFTEVSPKITVGVTVQNNFYTPVRKIQYKKRSLTPSEHFEVCNWPCRSLKRDIMRIS